MIGDEDERKTRRLKPPRRSESSERYDEGSHSGDEARVDPRKQRTRRRASIGAPTIPQPEPVEDPERPLRGHIDRAKSADTDVRRARRGRRASMVSSTSSISDMSVGSSGSYGYEDNTQSDYGYGDHTAPVAAAPGRRRGRRASISGPGAFPVATPPPEEAVAPSYDDKFGRSKEKEEEDLKSSRSRERRRPTTERSRGGQVDLNGIKSGDVFRESARAEPVSKPDSLIMPITIPDAAEKRPRRRASMLGAVGGAVGAVGGAVGGVVGSAAQKVGGAVIRSEKEKPRHRKGPEVDDIPKIAGNERRARGTMLDRLS
ncbi:hypothetical protein FisN_16Hh131 [Fistulifera solaris]|uniref:Uncharacterized protein n=1 Tax=Fistulifera solaris TaxID=1519565 RepID=A0A1Z5KTW3_FISSO|nr:hypothetical protein FisN_16Hh131 [Fistulifera solaris]|eukprot:GAX29428.1 hypothetical protein FisN_16Hh131 [Fistulifera solaris]